MSATYESMELRQAGPRFFDAMRYEADRIGSAQRMPAADAVAAKPITLCKGSCLVVCSDTSAIPHLTNGARSTCGPDYLGEQEQSRKLLRTKGR